MARNLWQQSIWILYWKILTSRSLKATETADQVEDMLKEDFGVFDIDIHIEGQHPIPESEILDNVYQNSWCVSN